MSSVAVTARHLFKKFRRGERHDSLRDLLPALWRSAFGRGNEARGLTDQEFWALNDVSFEIRRGEAVGIVGHNGAGKSTLLKHLTGILQPTRGAIEVNGRVSALIEIGAGFHPDLTGRENVFLNGVILGMSLKEIRRKFDEIVAFADMEEFIDTPVKRYSSGMFAKLGFSVAAHLDPDILLIDEVLSVGDFVFQQKGVQKMKQVAASGATVIFVSHNIKSVTDLCSRALLLNHGRVVEDGPTDQVIQGYLKLAERQRDAFADSGIVIESVTVRGREGQQFYFNSGERAWVEVEVRAVRPVRDIEIAVRILDQSFYEVVNVSTGRLGVDPFDLAAGQTFRCAFGLTLHLAAGTYQIGVAAVRVDIQHDVAVLMPAATICLSAPMQSRGVVNVYPELVVPAASKVKSA